MTNKQHIQAIAGAIDITADRRILLNGKQWGGDFSNPYTTQPSTKMLFQSVQQLIYSVYYTKSTDKADAVNYPTQPEIETFTQELARHNNNTERFDGGWQIEQVDMQGNITARKGNYKRLVLPGEFLNESSFHQKPHANGLIKLYARKDHTGASSGFYYVFGKTLAEDNNELLVRLYFNIKAEGAKKLVAAVSGILNQFNVPFSFKCLFHPFFYTRADAAVLYFDKRYSAIIFKLLTIIAKEIKPFLKKDTPLFTKQIAAGIGFAENPFNPEESFGTHTSKMIAQAIMHCSTNNISKEAWTKEILDNIQNRHGYKDIEKLYCNPGSVYPYNFPTISSI